MDPLTAFSLAASTLQVVDFSFKALGMCREIYKQGSIVEHTDMSEMADELSMQSPTALQEPAQCFDCLLL